VWDFPLVNVASALKISGGNIQQARIVVNAVAAHPLRLHAVEAAVAGKPQTEETASMAGELAIAGNQPLAHNGYKIPLMRNLVKRALRAEATS
jgi:xanthine dehydrogenase YagS FAD-binding subunit